MSRLSTFRPGLEMDARRSRTGPIRRIGTRSTAHRVRTAPTVLGIACRRNVQGFLSPSTGSTQRSGPVFLSTAKYSRNRPSRDQSESIFPCASRSSSPPPSPFEALCVNTVRPLARRIRDSRAVRRPQGEPLRARRVGSEGCRSSRIDDPDVGRVSRPLRSTAARRPSRDRATFQGPAGLGSPSVSTSPAGPVEPRQLGCLGDPRSVGDGSRRRNGNGGTRKERPTATDSATVTGSPESIRRAGSNRRATRAPWRPNSSHPDGA